MKATTTESLIGFLEAMSSSPENELEWVDLLSQLEYVGCRKIIKSVAFERVDLSLLRHVQEEALHAYLLKAVVEQGGVTGRAWTKGKFAAIGWRYFQELDHAVSALTGDAELRYPGVSWAVERRVLEIYPAYLKVTSNPALKRAITQILAQEKRHGAQFDEVTFPPGFREKVIDIEQKFFERFMNEMLEAKGS